MISKIKYLFTFVFFAISGYCYAQQQAFKSVNNEEFQKAIENKEFVIIDVRTPQEFASGHIPNAININLSSPNFEKEIKKIAKDKKIALYCRSGRRSKTAMTRLTHWGYSGIELNEGFVNWNGKIVR